MLVAVLADEPAAELAELVVAERAVAVAGLGLGLAAVPAVGSEPVVELRFVHLDHLALEMDLSMGLEMLADLGLTLLGYQPVALLFAGPLLAAAAAAAAAAAVAAVAVAVAAAAAVVVVEHAVVAAVGLVDELVLVAGLAAVLVAGLAAGLAAASSPVVLDVVYVVDVANEQVEVLRV